MDSLSRNSWHGKFMICSTLPFCTTRKQGVRRFLDLILLQIINDKPTYGYQMLVKTRKTFGVYFSTSTIYVLLRRLEKNGFIQSDWETSPFTGKPRRIYKLTDEGLGLLHFTENLVVTIYRLEHLKIERGAR